DKEQAAAVAEIAGKDPSQKERATRAAKQVASLWRKSDGDFVGFLREQFIADAKKLDEMLARMEYAFEMLDGHQNEIGRELRRATDLDIGPLLPVDPLLSAFDPFAHTIDDLFKTKAGFSVLANFPLTTLAERLTHGKSYDRKQWAEVRLAQRFARRVPGEVAQAIQEAASKSELYIAEYNVWMHHLINDPSTGSGGERLFPKGLRLISHWNLRDELKADYADPRSLDKQRTIV